MVLFPGIQAGSSSQSTSGNTLMLLQFIHGVFLIKIFSIFSFGFLKFTAQTTDGLEPWEKNSCMIEESVHS